MKTDTVGLVTLSFLSAILCWLPTMMTPRLDLPGWLPLCCVGLSAAISGFLNRQRWLAFMLTSAIGTFVGFCVGFFHMVATRSNRGTLGSDYRTRIGTRGSGSRDVQRMDRFKITSVK